jgi:hypothetical protein
MIGFDSPCFFLCELSRVPGYFEFLLTSLVFLFILYFCLGFTFVYFLCFFLLMDFINYKKGFFLAELFFFS